MRPLIIFYDDIFDEVYYLNNTNNIKDTSIIYCMKKEEFIKQFNYSDTVIEKWYTIKHPDFQQKIYLELINNIDKHTIKFINISNPNLKPKSFGWLKVLIVRIINDWLDYNLMNIYNPWYIDIDKYVKKWSNFLKKIKIIIIVYSIIFIVVRNIQLYYGGYDEIRKHLGLWILVLWVRIPLSTPLKPLQWTWKIKLSTLIYEKYQVIGIFFILI